ncbi:MAG: helix-turn-helix domain-containing protein [Candidatus Sericytochromatia bacterium]
MGLVWHFSERLADRGMDVQAFQSVAGFRVDPTWLESKPPLDMHLDMIALICETLQCQPGELVTLALDDPSAIAERTLAGDLFYQSFLSHRERQEDE